MNTKQKISLIVGVLAITISILYPNWVLSIDGLERDTIRGSIYSNDIAIFKKIEQNNDTIKGYMIRSSKIYIDYKRMLAEITIIIVLTTLIVFLLNKSTTISTLDKN